MHKLSGALRQRKVALGSGERRRGPEGAAGLSDTLQMIPGKNWVYFGLYFGLYLGVYFGLYWRYIWSIVYSRSRGLFSPCHLADNPGEDLGILWRFSILVFLEKN